MDALPIYNSSMSKLVSVLALCLAAVSNLLAATHAEKIDSLLAAYHKQRYFNGSALVAEKGQVIFRKGYGLANMEWDIPNAPDTKFRLGSITKQFTSMVIMQLVSEGKIKLDEKITTYLPDYRKDTGDRVTVRHLLTHTSGIPSYTGLPGFFQKKSRDPYTVDAFVKEYASGDLEFDPGSKFAYDNSGYFLLGAMIEKITGKSYADAVKERIFDPLGMKDSGYDRFDTVLPKRASGYALTPNGYVNAPYLDMSIPYAAGSLYSTVEDLYKWDRALYGDKLLSAELKKTMFTPMLQNYAFGWAVRPLKLDDQKTEVATIGHNGELAIANYKKSLELNPKNDNGAERLKRLEAPAQPKPDAATLDKYLGTFELRPGFNITFTREGDKLFSQATGQPKFEMAADSPTEFHPLAFRARIVFATDGSTLTLYQGGAEITAKRVAGK